MEQIIECDHITKKVGNFLLRDIHFELQPGYILGVIGKNGAGKSTLVRTLLGSYTLYTYMETEQSIRSVEKGRAVNHGDVRIKGFSLKEQPKEYKSELAFVLYNNPFSMNMSAKDNGLLYGAYYNDFNQEKYKVLCEQYEVPFRIPLKKLSKGEQIKMQLAFALSYNASVFVFDEPTGNLDIKFRDTFYDVMREIVEAGDKSIIYVTHLVEELAFLADYVLWIDEGRQIVYDSMEEFLDCYLLYSGPVEKLREVATNQIIYCRETTMHTEALLKCGEEVFSEEIMSMSRRATINEIMYYVEEAKR